MTTSSRITELHTQLQTMEARLRRLEMESGAFSGKLAAPWDTTLEHFHETLNVDKAKSGSPFALGLVHIIMQNADKGGTTVRLSICQLDSVTDLPDNKSITERLARLQLLSSDPLILYIFRYFYALRFAGKAMHATANELAEAVGTTEEKVTNLLKPLITDNTLLFDQEHDAYEWDGNDIAIATLLLTSP